MPRNARCFSSSPTDASVEQKASSFQPVCERCRGTKRVRYVFSEADEDETGLKPCPVCSPEMAGG